MASKHEILKYSRKIKLFSKMFYKSLFYLQHLEVILLIQTKHIITPVLIFRKYIKIVSALIQQDGHVFRSRMNQQFQQII